jgi:hypothetical protein
LLFAALTVRTLASSLGPDGEAYFWQLDHWGCGSEPAWLSEAGE